MTDPEAPKITFPCANYPIKVMGDAGEAFQAFVLTVVKRHAPDFEESSISIRPSSKGNYQSISLAITATGETQLRQLFEDLKANPLTRMVL